MEHPIFLLTDFGLAYPYVGVMKAVICGIAPEATVIDLTHDIPPQDIVAGVIALEDAVDYLPPGAVVCAVIDPGVGSSRRPIAGRAAGRSFVGPDNGLLTSLLQADPQFKAVELKASDKIRPDNSTTFHGRDVFAPAAALIAGGAKLAELGQPVSDLVPSPVPLPEEQDNAALRLTVLAADRFGNATLNLTRKQAHRGHPWIFEADTMIEAGDLQIHRIERTFADVPVGRPLVYWNSSNRLEIAVNQGSACRDLGLAPGSAVLLRRAGD